MEGRSPGSDGLGGAGLGLGIQSAGRGSYPPVPGVSDDTRDTRNSYLWFGWYGTSHTLGGIARSVLEPPSTGLADHRLAFYQRRLSADETN